MNRPLRKPIVFKPHEKKSAGAIRELQNIDRLINNQRKVVDKESDELVRLCKRKREINRQIKRGEL